MQQAAEHIDYKALYEQAQVKILALTFELNKLRKMIYSSKHERFIAANGNEDSSQLTLELDAKL